MKTLNPKKKLCIIKTNGPLHQLGHILGPIERPSGIPQDKIRALVKGGVDIHEVNPSNPKETIKLTLNNMNADNFPVNKVETVETVAPVAVAEPVPVVEPVEEVVPVEVVVDEPKEEVKPVQETKNHKNDRKKSHGSDFKK